MNYSNELKSIVIADNNVVDNPINVLKENSMTVQHFDYQCRKKRTESNCVYGVSEQVILKFTVRINSSCHAAVFYRCLNSNQPHDFSFLFNATFNNNERLADYEDGMVVNGYVVHIEENYNSQTEGQNDMEQILMTTTLLVRSVNYLGSEIHLRSIFIQ